MFLKLRKLSSTGVLGEVGQQASSLVAKQAVEVPQVLASLLYIPLSEQHALARCKSHLA